MCDHNIKVAVSESSVQNAQFLGEKMEAQRKDITDLRSQSWDGRAIAGTQCPSLRPGAPECPH